MSADVTVTRIGDGVYSVEQDGRREIVYVAGSPGDRWAFWNARVFHLQAQAELLRPARVGRTGRVPQAVTAPMPATVIKVLVTPGSAVRKGDTMVVLEAMKMELPIRAPGDGTVLVVNCREGELVQPDATLVELG